MSDALKIWQKLKSFGLTDAGVAGLMGNIQHESGLIPNRVEILCLKRIREYYGKEYTDATYTSAVDRGVISRAEFLNPLPGRQYGYGLTQTTTPKRNCSIIPPKQKKCVTVQRKLSVR